MSWLTDLLGNGEFVKGLVNTGVGTYGYEKLQGDFASLRDKMFEDGGRFDKVKGEATTAGQFIPYSMTSGLGASGMDAQGNMTMDLSQQQKNMANNMGDWGQNMMNQSRNMDPRYSSMFSTNQGRSGAAYGASNQAMQNSMMDTGQRETDVYNRIRAMQAPEEQRQMDTMNSGLFGSGRGGMTTEAYGGTPEQMAFGKAQAEARNAASLQAMGQAQNEMMNQGQLAGQYGNMAQGYGQQGLSALQAGGQYQGLQNQMGNQMFQNQYDPYKNLMAQNQQAMAGGQMVNQSGQAMSGLLSQLGLGGMTSEVNMANVQGDSLVGLLKMLGAGLGGAAGAAVTTPPTP